MFTFDSTRKRKKIEELIETEKRYLQQGKLKYIAYPALANIYEKRREKEKMDKISDHGDYEYREKKLRGKKMIWKRKKIPP